jgi:crotonobetainyl-CoA:carnitine CoA-transferase CaiB-like acyl-CoA transferase
MAFVVDLSQLPSARFCARLAALGGDEVLRFVPPAREGLESTGEAHDELREAYLADGVSVTEADFADQDGRTRIDRAIAQADVVISSYAAGHYHSPCDAERVERLNWRAVHVVVSPFGLRGPYRDLIASSLTDWAAGGYLHITGEPGRPPLSGPRDVCAYAAGYVAAIAMEVGLASVRSGEAGVLFDISHMEAMLSLHQQMFARLAAGDPMTRTGRDVGPATCPHGPYPGRDGDLFVGVVTDEEWDRLLIAIGRSELCGDPRLETGRARKAHAILVDEIVSEWSSAHDIAEAAQTLQSMRVPATPCATPGDLLRDPQLVFRSYFRDTRIGSTGKALRVPGKVIRWEPVGSDETDRAAHEWGQECVINRPGALPLQGVTVLDTSLWWAGPLATRILGDLGADVIRIDRPTLSRDPSTWPLSQRFVHSMLHRNKRSLVVDLNTAAGAAIVGRLMAAADVFVQNFRPGVVDRMGIGPERMLALNPRLVYVSLSGYGTSGPKAQWGTYGTLTEAASAVWGLTHYAGEGGMRLGDQLPDAVCGLAGTVAALRGLRNRATTQRGCSIDISQLEAYVALIGEKIAAASVGASGQRLEAEANDAQDIVVACGGADEWAAVTLPAAANSQEILSRLRQAIGVGPETGVSEALADFASSRNKWAVADDLQKVGVAAFPVVDALDLGDDPHLAERGSLVEVTVGPTSGRFPGSPIQAAHQTFVAFRRPAPLEGDHTVEILREKLFFEPDEIQRLLEAGDIRQRVELASS